MHHPLFEERSGRAAAEQVRQSLEFALQAASQAEKRLREGIEALPQGIVFLDEEGRYILWNEKYAEIYSRSADLLKPGVKLIDALRTGLERGDYPDATGREEEWLAERLERLMEPGTRHEQWLSNGRCIMIEERKIEGCGTIGIRVDITDLKQKEENYRLLFERNPLPMLVYDAKSGLIRSANEAASAFFGYSQNQLAGLPASVLFPEVLKSQAREMLAADHSDTDNCWKMLRRDGSSIEAVITTRLSQLENYAETIVSIFDITERRRIEQQLTHMARHDELTGLANRAFCREHLHEALDNAGPGDTVTIALVDLDHFKAVNETYGYRFGDVLLTEAASRMLKEIPPDTLLSRIGGDEFAIVFRHSGITEAELVAKAIIGTLSEPFFVCGHVIHIGATIGLASSPRDSRDAETLARYADLALYTAKGEQRGTCRSFETQMNTAAQEKSQLEKDLRVGLRQGELEVHYQPLVNLSTGEIECYEALLRWNHPTRGLVPPDVFVQIAEEMGLIDQIGRFVLHQACTDAIGWPRHVKVAVNVSPLQFRNGNLLSTVINALSSSGLSADRLELEITEAVLMEQGPRPAAIIRNLRAFGIGISLDDFGTGYSSLSYLLNYPFTKIKIDKSFIRNLHNEASSRAVIRAVIGLGRNLGLTVAAEGVENEIERDYLREEGCTQGQGYLFGKPKPPGGLIALHSRAA